MYFLFSSIVSFGATAQDASLLKADIYMEKSRFARAFEIYRKKLSNEESPELLAKAAYCLSKLDRFEEASVLYEDALKLKNVPDSVRLNYAECLQMNDDFRNAIENYSSYMRANPGNTRAMQGLASCDSALMWLKQVPTLTAAVLEKINSPFSEIAPVIYKGKLVFCSSREQTVIRKKSALSSEPFYDLYLSELNNEEWSEPENFSKSINTGLHEGPATFSAGFDTIYFSRNGEDASNNHLKLFSAVSTRNQWKEPSGFMLNDSIFSFAHPSISKDGNLFFFASDIPGGFGGTDLYVCIKADSNWSLPINLGENINTKGNELFPFYTSEGNLYFASDGHLGMGGFDIYFSEQLDGDWKTPLHLPPPVNSGADDFSFIPFPAWPFGIFSSNRKGGKGKEDLYHLQPITKGSRDMPASKK